MAPQDETRYVEFTLFVPNYDRTTPHGMHVSVDPQSVKGVRQMLVQGEQYTALDVSTYAQIILVSELYRDVMQKLSDARSAGAA